jgi:hypothetical protein
MPSIKKNLIRPKTKMDVWVRFLKSLESEGGSILVLVFLIGIVACLKYLGFKDADSQVIFILGALVGLLKGRVDNTINKGK